MPLSPTADVPYGRRWGSASATRHSAGGDAVRNPRWPRSKQGPRSQSTTRENPL